MSIHNIVYSSPEGYCITHYSRIVAAGTIFRHDSVLLGLTFIFNNSLLYSVQTIPAGKFRENHYNLVYLPVQTPCKLTAEHSGLYSAMNIHFTAQYLQGFVREFPKLKRLLNAARYPLLYSGAHLPLTEPIREKIESILHNRYGGIAQEIFISEAVRELLILCLRHITGLSDFLTASHPQLDIDRIEEVHDHLLDNLEIPCSVSELSSRFNIERRRLERGFKLCYGDTVYGFHLSERMKRASLLLKDTSLSVKEVAKRVGYKRVTSFSQVFKNKCGYTPRKVRQGNLVDSGRLRNNTA